MADNVSITAGSGTVIAADDVSSVFFQKVKIDVGGDGVSSPLVRGAQTAANSLPVTLATDDPAVAVLGAKGDDKSTATDTTAISMMAVLKELSYMAQNPASRAVTNAGTFAVQNTDSVVAATGKTIEITYSASQTGATVLTPTGGKKVVITDIAISASGAGAVYLFDGTDSASTRICPNLTLAANGLWSANLRKPWQSATADNVIKYTSGSGAAGSIWIHYYEV